MTDRNVLNILACQPLIPPTPTAMERDAHVSRLMDWLDRELTEQPADLTVLPELSTIDYSREAFANLAELAETATGPSFEQFSSLAKRHRCAVSFGFPRKAESGFRISQALIDDAGELIGVYDKIHLAQFGASMEKEYFQRGEKILVCDIAGFRAAPIICYDIRIPELCRTLAVEHGVELILHSGAYFRDESFPSWPSFAVTRAMENQIYFLSLNRAGSDYGASMFCRPWIEDPSEIFCFPETDEACLRLTVDRPNLKKIRQNYSFLADSLPAYR